MYRRLNTNAVSWKAAVGEDDKKPGVTKATAQRLVKEFFNVLYQAKSKNFPEDDDLFEYLAKNYYAKYEPDILAGNSDAYIERCS